MLPRELCQKPKTEQGDQHENQRPTSQEHAAMKTVQKLQQGDARCLAHRTATKEAKTEEASMCAASQKTPLLRAAKILKLQQRVEEMERKFFSKEISLRKGLETEKNGLERSLYRPKKNKSRN